MLNMRRIAVIGGGAAGLAAAISAMQSVHSEPVEVEIYEKSARVGKSILATGNGRCNFSNATLFVQEYYQSDFVKQAYSVLSPRKVHEWFSQIGLTWTQEAEGRLYPSTLRANTVVDVLRFAIRDLGVCEHTEVEVCTVSPVQDKFLITFANEETSWADSVIVSCGRYGMRALIPPIHRYENTEPILCALKTDTRFIKGLDGVRVRATVTVGGFQETGEVQFKKDGLSGIVIYNASRYARKGELITLDLFPLQEVDSIIRHVESLKRTFPSRTLCDLFSGYLHPRLVQAVRKQVSQKDSDTSEASIRAFTSAMKAFTLEITGKGNADQAQVMRGGFAVDGFDAHTMQSIHVPRLFLAGESLDIDGPCGGYNLHWAWTSGIIAGRNAVQALGKDGA